MGEFFGCMFILAVVITATVSNTTFRFDANDKVKMLTEVCSKNNGIEFSKIDTDSWQFKCKDGARFNIKR